MKAFLKKHGTNVLVAVIILLLFIPQTGMPIRVFISKLIAFSPSEVADEKQETLDNYHWSLHTLEGNEMNMSVSEGKVVLINFWATWCPPCVAEMPSLQNLYNEYGNRVDFYFVSQEDPSKLRRFMDKKDYNFPVYIQEYHAPDVIDAHSLPTTYIISKDGKIVMDKTGAANWDSEGVKALLERLLQ